MTLEDAILLDNILRMQINLNENPIYHQSSFKNTFEGQDLSPGDMGMAYLKANELFDQITTMKHNDMPIVSASSSKLHGRSYKTSAYTDEFLKDGGFEAYYLQHKKETERQQYLNDLEKKKLEFDLKVSKWLYKSRFWPHIISLASLGIAIWALLCD